MTTIATTQPHNRTLVLDQALRKTGFAVIIDDPDVPVCYGVNGRLINHGVIQVDRRYDVTAALAILKADLKTLIESMKPNEIVCENTFFFKQRNAHTNHAMSAVMQVVRDVAKEYGIDFYTLHPNTIKQRVTGYGVASKEEVKTSVSILWGIPQYKIKDDNHADALAAAYIWLNDGPELRAKAKEKQAGKKNK